MFIYDRLLETDKRALTRIKSADEMATDEVEQKNTDQKSVDQKSTDRKSVGSLPDNMEFFPDSPSLSRKATDEELWYV